MSETQRTKAATFQIVCNLQSGTDDVVHAWIAEELERELAAAQEKIKELDAALANCADEAKASRRAAHEEDIAMLELSAKAAAIANDVRSYNLLYGHAKAIRAKLEE